MFFRVVEDNEMHTSDVHTWCQFCDRYLESQAILDVHNRETHVYCNECTPWVKVSHFEHFHGYPRECDLCSGRHTSVDVLGQHKETLPLSR
jgi:Zn finger protein HypA/HybF involved in hydrogenase expression